MTQNLHSGWLLWLSGRLTLDSTTEIAQSATRATLARSLLSKEERAGIEADLADPEGYLIPAIANVIFQLRPLMMPIALKFQLNRMTTAQAAKYENGCVQMEIPATSLDMLQSALIRLLNFHGAEGREFAALLSEQIGKAGHAASILAEWIPPTDAEEISFVWPRAPSAEGQVPPLEEHSMWYRANVDDPAQCRALRRIVVAVWSRRQELLSLKANREKFPQATVPVAVLRYIEPWQAHRSEMTVEGLILRNRGGRMSGCFPGLLPEIAESLVDSPGTLAGLTARRLLRLLPRLAWKQAIDRINPFNRLVFNGMNDLAERLNIQSRTQVGMLRDILLAGQEWRHSEYRLPPLWQVWMPEVFLRGRTTSQIRIDVGEGLCPGFVSPEDLPHQLRWILPVLALPDLNAVGRTRQGALEALQWTLLMELRQSAAQGDVMGQNILLTAGQRERAADRAGLTRSEMERALYGVNGAIPWLAPCEQPGQAWLLDCGGERVRLSEDGAQEVLLRAAARADINRKRYQKKQDWDKEK